MKQARLQKINTLNYSPYMRYLEEWFSSRK